MATVSQLHPYILRWKNSPIGRYDWRNALITQSEVRMHLVNVPKRYVVHAMYIPRYLRRFLRVAIERPAFHGGKATRLSLP
jgi:hypothetical protein